MIKNLIKFDLKRILSSKVLLLTFIFYIGIAILPSFGNDKHSLHNQVELLNYINFYEILGWIFIASFAIALTFGNDYTNKTLPLVFTIFPKRINVIIVRVIFITIFLCFLQLLNYIVNITALNIMQVAKNPIDYFDAFILRVYLFQCIEILFITMFTTAITLLIKNGRFPIIFVIGTRISEGIIINFLLKDPSKNKYLPFTALSRAFDKLPDISHSSVGSANKGIIHGHFDWQLASYPFIFASILLIIASIRCNKCEV